MTDDLLRIAPKRGLTLRQRFERLVKRGDGCHEWIGHKHLGYGRMAIGGRLTQAHRVAWGLEVGPIPDGLLVLHKCNNKSCVRVDHLYVGTVSDNALDASAAGTLPNCWRDRTHCKHGHEYTESNTAWSVSRGYRSRRCRECSKVRALQVYYRARARIDNG